MKRKFIPYFLTALMTLTTFAVNAQSLTASAGADFVTRYIWRGLELGNAFSIQPSLGMSFANFDLGFWGSYQLINTDEGTEEMDFYLAYSLGNFTVLVTDYYFPTEGLRYGSYDEPGVHTIEVGLSYGGSDSFPFSASAFVIVYNDDDNSV